MPRPLRTIDPEGVYHVICRGNNKSQIFHDVDDYLRYLSLLRIAKKNFSFSLFHYALMPNHIHVIVRLSEPNLSEFMHKIQMEYAKKYCLKYNFIGHVWQGRFKNIQIETDAYLFACGNYIEMNPVRANLVNAPENWEWSSYRAYALGKDDPLVDIDPFFSSLGMNDQQRRIVYRDHIQKTRVIDS